MWQCLYFQIYKRFQIIEDGMTGLGPHYYMHEMRGREIISIHCDCGHGQSKLSPDLNIYRTCMGSFSSVKI